MQVLSHQSLLSRFTLSLSSVSSFLLPSCLSHTVGTCIIHECIYVWANINRKWCEVVVVINITVVESVLLLCFHSITAAISSLSLAAILIFFYLSKYIHYGCHFADNLTQWQSCQAQFDSFHCHRTFIRMSAHMNTSFINLNIKYVSLHLGLAAAFHTSSAPSLASRFRS